MVVCVFLALPSDILQTLPKFVELRYVISLQMSKKNNGTLFFSPCDEYLKSGREYQYSFIIFSSALGGQILYERYSNS